MELRPGDSLWGYEAEISGWMYPVTITRKGKEVGFDMPELATRRERCWLH